MIPDGVFFDLLERVAEREPAGRSIPMQVGASMRCDDYGAFGLAFKSALDLAGSYRRVERYGRVVTSIANFRLLEDREPALFEVMPGSPDRPGLRLTNELALAAAVALSREVADEAFAPLAVHLSQEAPEDSEPFHAHFACPIQYDAGRDALVVSSRQLERANRLGDAAICRFFDGHLDGALQALPDASELIQRLREAISRALSGGPPRLTEIARGLTMSPRTLQRRLAEADVLFQALVSEVQQGLARELLAASECSLAEVAFLTGFGDQSSFGRAFRRWTGQTPRAYRLSHSAAASGPPCRSAPTPPRSARP
ncbi:AraC family transcriptional regulator [Synechococcus sp. RSCCF101]|uniref:helix-turn-helix transcriptional regulator n=1 Tax=Synechococcus sp. RSCCF101 TaxID=2511069 RepID=UPI0012447008|nr:AraC family transcriptional regulator [Synechococcus sp. RSCCF101]QEY32715.1 AraC family transcriptional regulator [Synechococcus sp. RSCCF101]